MSYGDLPVEVIEAINEYNETLFHDESEELTTDKQIDIYEV